MQCTFCIYFTSHTFKAISLGACTVAKFTDPKYQLIYKACIKCMQIIISRIHLKRSSRSNNYLKKLHSKALSNDPSRRESLWTAQKHSHRRRKAMTLISRLANWTFSFWKPFQSIRTQFVIFFSSHRTWACRYRRGNVFQQEIVWSASGAC